MPPSPGGGRLWRRNRVGAPCGDGKSGRPGGLPLFVSLGEFRPAEGEGEGGFEQVAVHMDGEGALLQLRQTSGDAQSQTAAARFAGASLIHAALNIGRGFCFCPLAKIVEMHRRNLHDNIDPIQQRA